MPITPFNDLRNPHSVNQPTSTMGVDTGTGYAVIVRLKSIVIKIGGMQIPFIAGIPTALQPWMDNIVDGPVSSVDNPGCQGDPSDPSYTAFISYDDYVNSDMQHIAQSFLMWEKGQNILYMHENWDHPYLKLTGTAYFSWEIIEVVDEATYNNGAGVPQGSFISQATYGEIPVGTITANPLAASSNNASSLYELLYVPQNQGLDCNNHPGFEGIAVNPGNSTLFLEEPNPLQYAPTITPPPGGFTGTPGAFSNNYAVPISPQNPLFMSTGAGTVNNVQALLFEWSGYTRGFYIGTYAAYNGSYNFQVSYGTMGEHDQWIPHITEDGTSITQGAAQALCAPVNACRNPLALNYDTTTTPFYNWLANQTNPNNGTIFTSAYGSLMRDYQDDCDEITFDPNVPTGIAGFGDQSCCIFPPDAGPVEIDDNGGITFVGAQGCQDINFPSDCGCTDSNAANFNSNAGSDCSGVAGQADQSCCTYYHTWEFCGGTGLYSSYTNPEYINLVGSLPASSDFNTPATNDEFMNYYINQPGSGYTGPFVNGMVSIGTTMQLRSIGNPGSFMCMSYVGPGNDTAANLYPGNGTFWDSTTWWNSPPALDGNGDLIVPSNCDECNAPVLASLAVFEQCNAPAGQDPIKINLINTWATDPADEQSSQGPTTPSFHNDIDCSTFGCSACNQTWLLTGMVLRINPAAGVGIYGNCWRYLGVSQTPEGPGPSWIEGVGPLTSNFLKVDPNDLSELSSISDTCPECINQPTVCNNICVDPASIDYVAGPWQVTDCDCNGDTLATQVPSYNPGWNSCCTPCDNTCNDPSASNYVQGAAGCCGSGPGIGAPTWDPNGTQTQTLVFSGLQYDFLEWVTTQANGYTGYGGAGNGVYYEDLSHLLLATPWPAGACVGPSGGTYMWYQGGFIFYGVTTSYAAGFNPGTPTTPFDSWDDVLSTAMGGASAGCPNCPVTGVTGNTTINEFRLLLQAWNTAETGTDIGPLLPAEQLISMGWNAAQCTYDTYAVSTNCCTYNWRCISQVEGFNENWPDLDSESDKNQILHNWDEKYSGNYDFNPSPANTWDHTEDTGYISPSLEYLNISLRYSPLGNLGFNLSTTPGDQGWGTGKQPKINQGKTKDSWRFATAFMDDFTGGGSGSYTNETLTWDMDLSKSYYRVKTNMISAAGSFLNPGSKVITEPIIGGTKETGLYYLIIPTGSIRIRQGFEPAFPNTSGKEFNTWRLFIESLQLDGLPNELYEQNWTVISQWVLSHVEDFNTSDKNKENAAPEFTPESMSYMVRSSAGCHCIMDPNGPYTDQAECETMTIEPGSGAGAGTQNCCACIYGCTDPAAFNYDPLATCDDESCIGCDPLIMRRCDDAQGNYYEVYLGDNNSSPQTCTNSAAVISGFGMTSFNDVIHLDYIDANNTDPNPIGQDIDVCWQWIDNNDPDFLSAGIYGTYFMHTDLVLPNPGLTQTLLPWNGTDTPDEACVGCGDTPGCTDPLAMNYDVNATIDDGSCEYCVYGCMDDSAGSGAGQIFSDVNGQGPLAVYDCNVSTTVPITASPCTSGSCMPGYTYNNYNPCATCDDGSCTSDNYHLWKECGEGGSNLIIIAPGPVWTDIAAQQWFYDQMMSPGQGGAIHADVGGGERDCYEYVGTIPDPSIYMPISPRPAMADWYCCDTSCESCECIYGCTDDSMCNYDANATCDDGTCCNLTGCLDPQAFNYCPTCCCEGPCEAIKEGCMDPNSTNYDPTANTECKECCEYIVPGCLDTGATNYNPLATVDDGSCEFLNQCKREKKEFGANPTKKLDVECSFASDVYKEYRKQRYGLSNYCGSDLPDHLHEKELCDWEDSKRPAYLSSTIKVLDTYCYPIIHGEEITQQVQVLNQHGGLLGVDDITNLEVGMAITGDNILPGAIIIVITPGSGTSGIVQLSSGAITGGPYTVTDPFYITYGEDGSHTDWFDPLRPTWTNDNCGLSSDVDIDMYFAYDTTSMGLEAIKNQRLAVEDWLSNLRGRGLEFAGNVYHTLVLGERWLDWGTSVLTGVWNNSGSCGGTDTGCTPGQPVDHGNCPSGSYVDAVSISSMLITHRFWTAVDWGNNTNREWFAAMPASVTNGPLTHSGFPPKLSKRQVLSVNFADEAASMGTTTGLDAQPYHIAPGPAEFGTATWTQATDGTDGTTITPCWKADYDFWIQTYNAHIAKGDAWKATMVIYPAKPIPEINNNLSQTAFPLHVLGGVDSGNNDPQDGRYATGTAPQNDIVNLVNIENGNPYWDAVNPNQPNTHLSGYGGLDKYGWQANVREAAFDANTFKEDLEGYWDPKRLVCDDSECIVLNVVNQNNVAVSDYDIYLDGGFVGKTDEYGRLLFTIPNASVKTNHILNLCLCLVTTGNCCQQNIKITVEEECAPACCEDPTGVDCGDYYTPPSPQVFEGCTDPNASNYQTLAQIDDGSCEYCGEPMILYAPSNVNVSAPGASDGSITLTVTNGTLPYTFLWSSNNGGFSATTQNISGIPGGLYTVIVTDANGCDESLTIAINEPTEIYGCIDNTAGLWPNINGVNQSNVNCTWPCSDDNTVDGTPEGYLYFCYDPDADLADTCCLAGCTNQSSINYDAAAGYDCNLQDINANGYAPSNGWNSCCIDCNYGCTNPAAGNYDASATCEDGSCIFLLGL